MSTSRIPPLLEPYLSLPPQSSHILLSGVLGASTNWLVLRWLYALLRNGAGKGRVEERDGEEEGEGSTGVVLVSFLRDAAFWREGVAKTGLDLESASRSGNFVFVDGLSGLFAGEGSARQSVPSPASSGNYVLKAGRGLERIATDIEAALGQLKTERKVLVLDQPDVLLAASGDGVGSQAVQDLILRLRESVRATILTLSADDPLVHTQQTTLEKEHAALLAGQAHAADGWAGLRMLDTGVARDVSGVVRWARREGGTFDGDGVNGGGKWEEREMLYWVGADGGVKVFERGTA